MCLDDLLQISCAPIADFTLFLLNNLLNLLSFGKHFLKSLKNSFPIFVETWLLKGGLYQMMLRFVFFSVYLSVDFVLCI